MCKLAIVRECSSVGLERESVKFYVGGSIPSISAMKEKFTDFNGKLRATNVYYRLWFLRRKIRPLLPYYIG